MLYEVITVRHRIHAGRDPTAVVEDVGTPVTEGAPLREAEKGRYDPLDGAEAAGGGPGCATRS